MMTTRTGCKICAPAVLGQTRPACGADGPCKATGFRQAFPAFIAAWRAYADALQSTPEQAAALLPGLNINEPVKFVDGYKQGIYDFCDELPLANEIWLDPSGSVGSHIGYGSGVDRGWNHCLAALNELSAATASSGHTGKLDAGEQEVLAGKPRRVLCAIPTKMAVLLAAARAR